MGGRPSHYNALGRPLYNTCVSHHRTWSDSMYSVMLLTRSVVSPFPVGLTDPRTGPQTGISFEPCEVSSTSPRSMPAIRSRGYLWLFRTAIVVRSVGAVFRAGEAGPLPFAS